MKRGLPKLEALTYLKQDNVLGLALAALMHIPPDRQAWLKAETLRRLAEKPLTEQQRFLLAECVQAYLELAAGAEQEEFERLLVDDAFKEVKTMGTTQGNRMM